MTCQQHDYYYATDDDAIYTEGFKTIFRKEGYEPLHCQQRYYEGYHAAQ
jgi:hypothetical protein